MLEQYYFGQGRVYSRKYGVAGAKWRWWGDVSDLKAAGASDKVTHKESYSGKKGTVRSFGIGDSFTLTGTLHQIDTAGLADLLGGTVTTVDSGVVTGEDLGTVAVGDIIKLDYPGVSSLVISDSAATPVVIDAAHYDADVRFGTMEFLALPSAPAPTMPLTAAYSYAGYSQVAFFTQALPILEFRYEGVNLAEDEAPVIVEWYKVGPEPLKELALIQSGNTLAGSQFSLEALYDASKPLSGNLGRFGRFIQVAQS